MSGFDIVTVDADGHVLEPRDTWQRYLEPESARSRDPHRARRRGRRGPARRRPLASRAARSPRRARRHRDGLRRSDDGRAAQLRRRLPAGRLRPARAAARSWTPRRSTSCCSTRPSASPGKVWCSDPQLATAYCRAYNRWIVDFCSADRRRLVPIAHICLLDPEGAVAEVERARKDGCAGVYLSPDLRCARRHAVRRSEPGAVLGDRAGPRACRSPSTSSRGPTRRSRHGRRPR